MPRGEKRSSGRQYDLVLGDRGAGARERIRGSLGPLVRRHEARVPDGALLCAVRRHGGGGEEAAEGEIRRI